jgi:hypothetical protein
MMMIPEEINLQLSSSYFFIEVGDMSELIADLVLSVSMLAYISEATVNFDASGPH